MQEADQPQNRKNVCARACEDSPCIDLIVTENRLTQLANEFYDFKAGCDKARNEMEVEWSEITDKLDAINNHLERQKGFFAGVVWLGAGIIAVAGTAMSYFKG